MRAFRSGIAAVLVLLAGAVGWSGPNPAEYKRISQCVLVRERQSLVGTKVQLTGEFLGGGNFCYKVPKVNIHTKNYLCFAVGKTCIIRLYLKKDDPGMDLLFRLEPGDEVTAYGTFDYMGTDYNYMILDGITVKKKSTAPP
ncbi:MAG: hypothetical protein HZB55_14185 [Deltaproteobacteria bacterium]|nr:hypothetical protein [Deltaproteobacteria bacterium]